VTAAEQAIIQPSVAIVISVSRIFEASLCRLLTLVIWFRLGIVAEGKHCIALLCFALLC
jgi:hypothetical protein